MDSLQLSKCQNCIHLLKKLELLDLLKQKCIKADQITSTLLEVTQTLKKSEKLLVTKNAQLNHARNRLKELEKTDTQLKTALVRIVSCNAQVEEYQKQLKHEKDNLNITIKENKLLQSQLEVVSDENTSLKLISQQLEERFSSEQQKSTDDFSKIKKLLEAKRTQLFKLKHQLESSQKKYDRVVSTLLSISEETVTKESVRKIRRILRNLRAKDEAAKLEAELSTPTFTPDGTTSSDAGVFSDDEGPGTPFSSTSLRDDLDVSSDDVFEDVPASAGNAAFISSCSGKQVSDNNIQCSGGTISSPQECTTSSLLDVPTLSSISPPKEDGNKSIVSPVITSSLDPSSSEAEHSVPSSYLLVVDRQCEKDSISQLAEPLPISRNIAVELNAEPSKAIAVCTGSIVSDTEISDDENDISIVEAHRGSDTPETYQLGLFSPLKDGCHVSSSVEQSAEATVHSTLLFSPNAKEGTPGKDQLQNLFSDSCAKADKIEVAVPILELDSRETVINISKTSVPQSEELNDCVPNSHKKVTNDNLVGNSKTVVDQLLNDNTLFDGCNSELVCKTSDVQDLSPNFEESILSISTISSVYIDPTSTAVCKADYTVLSKPKPLELTLGGDISRSDGGILDKEMSSFSSPTLPDLLTENPKDQEKDSVPHAVTVLRQSQGISTLKSAKDLSLHGKAAEDCIEQNIASLPHSNSMISDIDSTVDTEPLNPPSFQTILNEEIVNNSSKVQDVSVPSQVSNPSEAASRSTPGNSLVPIIKRSLVECHDSIQLSSEASLLKDNQNEMSGICVPQDASNTSEIESDACTSTANFSGIEVLTHHSTNIDSTGRECPTKMSDAQCIIKNPDCSSKECIKQLDHDVESILLEWKTPSLVSPLSSDPDDSCDVNQIGEEDEGAQHLSNFKRRDHTQSSLIAVWKKVEKACSPKKKMLKETATSPVRMVDNATSPWRPLRMVDNATSPWRPLRMVDNATSPWRKTCRDSATSPMSPRKKRLGVSCSSPSSLPRKKMCTETATSPVRMDDNATSPWRKTCRDFATSPLGCVEKAVSSRKNCLAKSCPSPSMQEDYASSSKRNQCRDVASSPIKFNVNNMGIEEISDVMKLLNSSEQDKTNVNESHFVSNVLDTNLSNPREKTGNKSSFVEKDSSLTSVQECKDIQNALKFLKILPEGSNCPILNDHVVDELRQAIKVVLHRNNPHNHEQIPESAAASDQRFCVDEACKFAELCDRQHFELHKLARTTGCNRKLASLKIAKKKSKYRDCVLNRAGALPRCQNKEKESLKSDVAFNSLSDVQVEAIVKRQLFYEKTVLGRPSDSLKLSTANNANRFITESNETKTNEPEGAELCDTPNHDILSDQWTPAVPNTEELSENRTGKKVKTKKQVTTKPEAGRLRRSTRLENRKRSASEAEYVRESDTKDTQMDVCKLPIKLPPFHLDSQKTTKPVVPGEIKRKSFSSEETVVNLFQTPRRSPRNKKPRLSQDLNESNRLKYVGGRALQKEKEPIPVSQTSVFSEVNEIDGAVAAICNTGQADVVVTTAVKEGLVDPSSKDSYPSSGATTWKRRAQKLPSKIATPVVQALSETNDCPDQKEQSDTKTSVTSVASIMDISVAATSNNNNLLCSSSQAGGKASHNFDTAVLNAKAISAVKEELLSPSATDSMPLSGTAPCKVRPEEVPAGIKRKSVVKTLQQNNVCRDELPSTSSNHHDIPSTNNFKPLKTSGKTSVRPAKMSKLEKLRSRVSRVHPLAQHPTSASQDDISNHKQVESSPRILHGSLQVSINTTSQVHSEQQVELRAAAIKKLCEKKAIPMSAAASGRTAQVIDVKDTSRRRGRPRTLPWNTPHATTSTFGIDKEISRQKKAMPLVTPQDRQVLMRSSSQNTKDVDETAQWPCLEPKLDVKDEEVELPPVLNSLEKRNSLFFFTTDSASHIITSEKPVDYVISVAQEKSAFVHQRNALGHTENVVKEALKHFLAAPSFTPEVLQKAVDTLSDEGLAFASHVIIRDVVGCVEDDYDTPLSDVVNTNSLAPLLTPVQQQLVTLVLQLSFQREQYHMLPGGVLKLLEYRLFRLGKTPEGNRSVWYAQLYAAISRALLLRKRALIFCWDALYSLKASAHSIILAVLKIWPALLPYQLNFEKACPNTQVLMHILLTKTESNVSKKISSESTWAAKQLKKMLGTSGPCCSLNSQLLLSELCLSLIGGKSNLASPAIVLLSKKEGEKWALNHAVNVNLLPALESWRNGALTDFAAEGVIWALGAILRAVNLDGEKSIIQTTLKLFINDLSEGDTVSPHLQEALVTGLTLLSRHDIEKVAYALMSWKPHYASTRGLSPYVIDHLKGLVNNSARSLAWWLKSREKHLRSSTN